MPRHEHFSSQPRHHAQRLGPFARIALRLLRIARVGRGPDDQISGAQHFALRNVYPAMVVGLAARMMAFELVVARNYIQLTIEVSIRIYILSRPRRGPAELPRIDYIVIASGALVAIESRRDCAMAHDARPRDLVLLRIRDNRRHPARVIDVPMRVDRSVHPLRRELPNQLDGRVLVEVAAGVDQHQSLARLGCGHVRKPAVEHHAVGNFLVLAGRQQRMELPSRNRAGKNLFRLISNHAHGFQLTSPVTLRERRPAATRPVGEGSAAKA